MHTVLAARTDFSVGAQRLGYQAKLMQGLMEHRTATHQTNDGHERTSTQCRITSAGLARLARIFAEDNAT